MLRLTERSEERELLRKCLLGDLDARKKFSTRSYRREALRAARLTLVNAATVEDLCVSDDEIEAFAVATMEWLFSRWQDLPSRLFGLHRVIRTVVTGITKNYWKQRRKTLKMKA